MTTFRSYYGPGLGALGVIAPGQQDALLTNTDPLRSALDAIGRRINTLSASGSFGQAQITRWWAARTELAAELDALRAAVLELDDEEAVVPWRQWRGRLEGEIVQLGDELDEADRASRSSTGWSIGLWTAAAVVGVIGTVVLVRRYGRRRR